MDTQKPREMKMNRTAKRPSWWTDQHTSSWDRVKDAFRRDWEQTKADLTGQKKGRDLNQSLGDTVKQATGSEPIPPPYKQNLPDEPKSAAKRIESLQKTAEKADEKMAKAQGEIAKAGEKRGEEIAEARNDLAKKRNGSSEDLAKAHEKAAEKISSAREDAGEKMMKEREKIAEAQRQKTQALEDWSEVESAMRYGYCVRSQYPNTSWDNALEAKLEKEWSSHGDRAWNESKDYVRRGWNLAGKH